MKFIVSWSGGKDSQAALIWAKEQFGQNLTVIFCDTGWEHKTTYQHVQDVVAQMGLQLTVLKSKKYDGMVDLAKKSTRFPSRSRRFCTQELKVIPTIDYILDEVKGSFMIIEGIRAEESITRSMMKDYCQYFKYYFEPYKSNQITVETLGNRENLSMAQKIELEKAKERLAIGKNDEKYYTYRKKEIVAFIRNQYAAEVYRPVFDLTAEQVIAYIYDHGQQPNPLYFQGAKRVGCYPCIVSGLQEINAIGQDAEYRERLIAAEAETGSTFFGPNVIPKRYQTGIDARSGKKIPTAEDVFRYVEYVGRKSLDLFPKPENHRCMSHYAICE